MTLVGCASGTFNGEWVKGDWDTRSAWADCQRIVGQQSYPARCEQSGFNAETNYGEVWLLNTADSSTKSGESITKIWKLQRL
jgi:hypothetical protein